MSIRRTHTKARTGCDNCKRRHIKCDELGPPCANCQVRGLECLRTAGHEKSKKDLQASPQTPQSSISNIESGIVVGSRILELELIHHWSTNTYRGFHITERDWEAWQITLPRDALKYDFLLNSLFGITSLHIAITTMASQSRSYQLAALEYQNLAISTFQASSPSLSPDNHQAIFTFSCLNLALSFALPYYLSRDLQPARPSIVQNIATLFGLLQGATSIFRGSMPWLVSGPFGELIDEEHVSTPLDDLPQDVRDAFARLNKANNEGYLAICNGNGSSFDAVQYLETNTRAIDSLVRKFCRFAYRGPITAIGWLAEMDKGFVEAVSKLEPVALLITMHWGILLDKFSEEKWWAKASGRLLVTELGMTLRQTKPEWREAVEWVHKQVGLPVPEPT